MTLSDLTRWQRRIFDWQSAEHAVYCERMRAVCDNCELRKCHTCIGAACPVHATLDELNHTPKKIENTTRYIYDKLVRKYQEI